MITGIEILLIGLIWAVLFGGTGGLVYYLEQRKTARKSELEYLRLAVR